MLVVDAFDGLKLVASQTLDLKTPSPQLIRFAIPAGFTSLLMRGTVIEMAEATPVRMRIFDQVREVALNWDGRDPIRMNWPQG